MFDWEMFAQSGVSSVREHDMPSVLEETVMVAVSLLESSSATTKYLSPLPQCLWPADLVGW